MGLRQDILKEAVYRKFKQFRHRAITLSDIEEFNFVETVSKVYKNLGGRLKALPVRYGNWDVSTEDFIIELDEERHFNRYRSETLNSDFYSDHSFFSIADYKSYCHEREKECLKAAKWGQNWKNSSTEKMFIKSNVDGDLAGNGSSRWRQRAYYDFLKDLTSKVINTPVIRVSIYDSFHGLTVDEILARRGSFAILNEFIDNLVQW